MHFSKDFSQTQNKNGPKIIPDSACSSEKNVRFVALIMLLVKLLKAIKLFKMRTKFRTMPNLNENQLEIIDDSAYILIKDFDKNSKLRFIYNKTLRKTIRTIRRFSKKHLNWLKLFFGKISFLSYFYFPFFFKFLS